MLGMFRDMYLVRLFISVREMVYSPTSTRIWKKVAKNKWRVFESRFKSQKSVFFKLVNIMGVTIVIEMR